MNSCDHCDAIRFRQSQIAWGGQALSGAMPLPMKYFTPADEPSQYDADPGPCPCRCHDVWRTFVRLLGT